MRTCSEPAGAPGKRRSLPNARIMIHQPVRTTGGKDSSNARQLQIHAQSIEKSRLRIAELLALRTPFAAENMAELTARVRASAEFDVRAARWRSAGSSPATPWR